MVLLESGGEIDGQAVFDDFAHRWCGEDADVPSPENLDTAGGISFGVGQAHVVAVKMPAPIPWSDLEGPCATGVLWDDAVSEVKRHQSHVIITVIGSADAVASSVLLTQATVSLMAATQAMGVYWCNASMLVPRDLFTDVAMEVMPFGPPLLIWVDFRVGKDEGRTSSGFTTGMHALDHREFTAKGVKEPPDELRNRLIGLCEYVISNGPVINDGCTVGQDRHEKIRVVYGESDFGHENEVIKLVYEQESPELPW
jgi:hypothetical protein